jgi:hypothetical protein
VIVVLEDAQHIVQLCSRYENHAHPVMNQPSGADDRLPLSSARS